MSNKINMNLTCYMCENQKTSVEHVPPLCFFPERKDTPENNDYRKNLITVSSCDVHNSRKSKDDEFMYIVMACNGKANDLAKLHQNTKIERILKRTPAVFVSLMKAAKPHYSITDGELKESCVWEIDLVRFDNHMSNMANALYYYTYGKKISGYTCVVPISGFTDDYSTKKKFNRNIKAQCEDIFCSTEVVTKGENPDVFYYQVVRECDFLMKMVFFSSIEFIASFGLEHDS